MARVGSVRSTRRPYHSASMVGASLAWPVLRECRFPYGRAVAQQLSPFSQEMVGWVQVTVCSSREQVHSAPSRVPSGPMTSAHWVSLVFGASSLRSDGESKESSGRMGCSGCSAKVWSQGGFHAVGSLA